MHFTGRIYSRCYPPVRVIVHLGTAIFVFKEIHIVFRSGIFDNRFHLVFSFLAVFLEYLQNTNYKIFTILI